MKILAIRGCNIASLEGPFEVDFTHEPLSGAGLFSITGPTGSGKSTILDAMCLALFGRTPRTEQARETGVKVADLADEALVQGDPRFLLRRGTASGFAETDFLALDGHRYRARWAVARARERVEGRLQAVRLSVQNLDTGQEESGTRSELERHITGLIGLTFDQFTRSVLLAQNEFSTFLQAGQSEKAELLEKLTGTGQYSAISRLIYEKAAQAREACRLISLQMETIALLPEEEEKQGAESLKETKQRLERLGKLREEQKRLEEAVDAAEKAIAAKETQQKEASALLARADALLADARRKQEEAVAELQAQELHRQKLLPELQAARALDVRIESLAKAQQEAAGAFRRAADAQKKNENALARLAADEKKRAGEIAGLTEWFARYREKEAIVKEHSSIELHLRSAWTASQAKAGAEKSAVRIRKIIEGIDRETGQLGLEPLPDAPSLPQMLDGLRRKRESLVVEQTRFATSGDVKALRDKLTDGTPCPVCGSTDHPYASAQVIGQMVRLGEEIASTARQIGQLETLTHLLAQRQEAAGQLSYEEKERDRQQALLTASLAAIDALFGHGNWQTAWQHDPEDFRKTLTAFSAEWKRKTDDLHALESLQASAAAERKSYEAFLDTLRRQTAGAQKALDEKTAALQTDREKRMHLLDGKSADEAEQALTQTIDRLKQQQTLLQQTQAEQSAIASQSRGTLVQINTDLTKARDDLAVRQKARTGWIDALARQTDLSGRPLDEQYQEAYNRQTELLLLLRKQDESRRQMDALRKAMEAKQTVADRWAKLNDLAGSADGAKFRRIAQGYTLDVLLGYANAQLRNLTQRYRLGRIPETLGLQVVDRDMCDEIRTVHSLSGGESFLVSLALALGLSSLSSNRMSVESLFIDEGFGSLDAETLRTAIDALDALQTQGRKIGVISHVQEMTERIPVQIKITPAGNGRSYVSVSR